MAGRLIRLLFRADGTRATIRDIELVGDASERTQRRIEAAQRRSVANLAAVGRGATAAGRAMVAASIPLLGLGYYSAKSAISFEQAMTRIQTQAGVSGDKVKELTHGVMGLGQSGQVQYGPTQLANALYHIESVAAGGTMPALKKTSVAMNVLKIAAQGAAVGGSDLEQTTTALMGALYATHTPIQKAGDMMGLLNATVGAGNMRMQDLVSALGRGVIPAFQNVGLTATDAFAALALFADQGTNASSAAAQMSTALHYLVKPSKEADKVLGVLHMSTTQMAEDLHKPHGMLVALRDFRDHLATLRGGVKGVEASQAIFSLFPGGRGRIMQQAINNLDQYGNKIDAIYHTQGKFKDSVTAQQATMAGKLHTAWAKIQTDMTTFGSTLIPIIAKYLPKFLKIIQDLFTWFDHLSRGTKDFLAKLAIGLPIIGGSLIVFGKLLTTLSQIWRVMQIIKGINLASAIFGAGNAAKVAAGEMGGLAAMSSRLGPLLSVLLKIGTAIAAIHFGTKAAPGLVNAIKHKKHGEAIKKGAIVGASGGALAGVLGGTELGASLGLAGGPLGVAGGAFLGGLAGAGAGLITSLFGGGAHGGVVTPKGIRRYHTGGPVGTDTVLGRLTPGEGILNRAAMAGLGTSGLAALNTGGSLGDIHVQPSPAYFMIDGRVIARSMINYTIQRAARGPSSLVGGALSTGAPAFGTHQ